MWDIQINLNEMKNSNRNLMTPEEGGQEQTYKLEEKQEERQ